MFDLEIVTLFTLTAALAYIVATPPVMMATVSAPPMIANAIVKYLPTDNYTTSVVAGFINFKMSDKELADVIEEAMNAHENHVISMPTLQEILDTEAWARSFVREHSTIVH